MAGTLIRQKTLANQRKKIQVMHDTYEDVVPTK